MKVLRHQCFASGLFLAIGALLLLSSCSSFNRDWNRAARQPAPPTSLVGRWEGRWSSDANGHNGQLRCLISSTNETECRARFRATYGQLLHFTYTVPLSLQAHYEGWEFDGQANLGALAGGLYYYEGRASTTNFYSTYRSKYDHGIFQMHRVP